jgi:4-hydroxy 2-oxovalerate aldolase
MVPNEDRLPFVLDVTLRDGGYVNGHSWSVTEAVGVVRSCVLGGVRATEVGYFRPQRHDTDGANLPSASCPPHYLEALRVAAGPDTMLVAMAHRRDVRLEQYRQLAEHYVGMVRLPTGIADFDKIGPHVTAIKDAGLLAGVNLIRVSEASLQEVATAAAAAERSGADIFYVADSNGSLFPDSVKKIVQTARAETARPLGFHAHDGLSMAFGNSLAAVEAGCTYLDASFGGMGKGGGNLRMELITAYLCCRAGIPFDVAPIADAAAADCEPIISGLLDMNLDDIAKFRVETGSGLVGMLSPASRS